jgi:YegS/Rv2252/BmrU family lipid kinase
VRIVANPISGLKSRERSLDRFREILEASGVAGELAVTEGPGHATELAAAACEGDFDAVVAVGGDGTVNEVVNGLSGTRVALATLPTGTANLLARELRIPFDAEGAARTVVSGRRRLLDAGRADGRRFLMVVGIGWDAHVVELVSSGRRGHLGQHRYLLPIARAILGYEFPPLSVTVDGVPHPRPVSLAFVCNTRNYGAFFNLTPQARPDDGLLDFLLLRNGHPRNYVRWVAAALAGRLPEYRDVDYVKGRRIEIRGERPVPWQADGDPGGQTPLTIEIEEQAVEVLVP